MIRLFNHYLSVRTLLLTAIEAMVLFQSVVLVFQLRMTDFSLRLPVAEAGVFTSVMLLMMTALGLYQAQAEPFRATVQRVLVAYGLSLVLMSFFFYVFPSFYVGRGAFLVRSLFAMAGVRVVRLVMTSASSLTWMSVGLPDAKARAKAGSNACVVSTRSACQP